MLPKFLRDSLIRLTKEEILRFIDDNQEELIHYFCNELEKLDERMPEEQLFIDIRMAALGEELFRAVFSAIRQFVKNY
ncbi:TPA: hypothetical protein EYP66_21200 [Candidatus Poribacteria bacterium]|nr:hypothetical protein [Candidatus Poribacteria bacterium]